MQVFLLKKKYIFSLPKLVSHMKKNWKKINAFPQMMKWGSGALVMKWALQKNKKIFYPNVFPLFHTVSTFFSTVFMDEKKNVS